MVSRKPCITYSKALRECVCVCNVDNLIVKNNGYSMYVKGSRGSSVSSSSSMGAQLGSPSKARLFISSHDPVSSRSHSRTLAAPNTIAVPAIANIVTSPLAGARLDAPLPNGPDVKKGWLVPVACVTVKWWMVAVV